jgi:hypothetical protein
MRNKMIIRKAVVAIIGIVIYPNVSEKYFAHDTEYPPTTLHPKSTRPL